MLATEGPIVPDENREKISSVTENILCCAAGTAADTEFTTTLISSNIWNRMLAQVARRNGHDDTEAISLPCRCLFSRHQGAIGAALVLAESNRHAHISSPHGSRDKLLCGTMGSGSLAAMAVFESRYSIAGRPPRQFLSLTSTRPARRISYVYT
ncbi:hypothetical protein BS47DRAFT_1486511 [Hydnum rufescens UP504]|uniref:Uncharacterized protein n=1 Tax=Hydnum rufescens UP504 TaxID=1448309 RepID=A0A9P6AU69_9AGAM|nr:hypothetical protein BS47DRAFT_1486511 [Hydnum rufescens UP504]